MLTSYQHVEGNLWGEQRKGHLAVLDHGDLPDIRMPKEDCRKLGPLRAQVTSDH